MATPRLVQILIVVLTLGAVVMMFLPLVLQMLRMAYEPVAF
jgi:hypothetical protein